MSDKNIISVENFHTEHMRQTFEKDNINVQMFAYLLNNSGNLTDKRFRITRLKLNFSVSVRSCATLQVISLKRRQGEGMKMNDLPEKDEEVVYGVQNTDCDFENKVSKSPTKRVVYERQINPNTKVAGSVTFETQKWYDYGPGPLPRFMLFVIIKTPDNPNGISHFKFERKMNYLIE